MNYNLGKRLRDRRELLAVFAELGYIEKEGEHVIGEIMEFTRDVPDGSRPFRGSLVSFEARWSTVNGKRVLKNISFYFSPVSRLSDRELLTIDLAMPSFKAVAFETGTKEAFPIVGRIAFVTETVAKEALRASICATASSQYEKLRLTAMKQERAVPPMGAGQADRISAALKAHLGLFEHVGETSQQHIMRIVGVPMAFEYTLGEGTELAEEAIFHGMIDALFPKWELKDGQFRLSELSFSFLVGSRLARFDLLLIDMYILEQGDYGVALVLANDNEVSLRGLLYTAA